jgi:putative MFS transporter
MAAPPSSLERDDAAPAAADSAGSAAAHGRPGWYRLTWFLGRAPALTPRQWQVLGLVSLVSLFEQYDLYLFALNLPLIQRELGIGESRLGFLGGLVNAGSAPAVLLAGLADRLGRRRLLLVTVVAYTLCTGATAFATTGAAFVALQFLARIFAATESLLAVVVIAEEFNPEDRGWGVGALGAITACGAGLASLLFGFVNHLPYGWRSLYLVGLVPLACLTWWRRAMPETQRFAALARTERGRPAARSAPLAALLRDYPGRLAAVAGATFLLWIVWSSALIFAPKYLLDVQHWQPAWIAALSFGGGAIGIIGNPVAGRMSDRFGRRPVTALFAAGFGASTAAFYSASGLLVIPLWILLIFTSMGASVTISACGAEMFPTSARSTASGVRSAASTLGGITGLALVSLLYRVTGSNWLAITLLAVAPFLAAALVLACFPETSGRPLEEIAPES